MDVDANLITEIVDRQRILDVIMRYARAADRRDPEIFAAVFWPDGGFEGGPIDGPSRDLTGAMCELLDHIMDVTQHFMLNSIIELDGGRAYGETYFIAYHRSRPTSDSAEAMLGLETLENLGGDRSRHYDYIIGGRYLDLFERRDDQWRIKTRRLVADWTKCGIATATTTGLVNKLRFRGSANRDDPSYEWLRGNPS